MDARYPIDALNESINIHSLLLHITRYHPRIIAFIDYLTIITTGTISSTTGSIIATNISVLTSKELPTNMCILPILPRSLIQMIAMYHITYMDIAQTLEHQLYVQYYDMAYHQCGEGRLNDNYSAPYSMAQQLARRVFYYWTLAADYDINNYTTPSAYGWACYKMAIYYDCGNTYLSHTHHPPHSIANVPLMHVCLSLTMRPLLLFRVNNRYACM